MTFTIRVTYDGRLVNETEADDIGGACQAAVTTFDEFDRTINGKPSHRKVAVTILLDAGEDDGQQCVYHVQGERPNYKPKETNA